MQAPRDTLSSSDSPHSRASRPRYPLAQRSLSAAPSTPTLNTDSQNISAQDYDDAVEATPTDATSANSTGTADEVGSHDGWVGKDGPQRGKSPRMVVAQYPPATREALLAELPPRPATVGPISVPHSLELSSSQPSASSGEELVPLNSEDVRNHPCLLTLSELEETTALLTGRVEFQTRRGLRVLGLPISRECSGCRPGAPGLQPAREVRPEEDDRLEHGGPDRRNCQARMVLERSFAPVPTGPKKPRPKVTLGGSKAPLPTDVPPAQGAVSTLPASSTGTAPAEDLQVARPTTRRGKEKATDQEVEEIPPPKKQKRPIARGSTPVLDALREGGEHTASFIDKVRAVIPTREAIRDLDTDQLSHMTNDLFCSAKAAENVVRKDVVPLRESLATKDKELTEKVQALEARIASAELEVEAAKRETAEMNEKMSSYANLSGFLCRDPREA
nr:uncharacterized protein LOC109184184 [Ipomoea batatas]